VDPEDLAGLGNLAGPEVLEFLVRLEDLVFPEVPEDLVDPVDLVDPEVLVALVYLEYLERLEQYTLPMLCHHMQILQRSRRHP
jgi:hypothetical protein